VFSASAVKAVEDTFKNKAPTKPGLADAGALTGIGQCGYTG